MKKIQRYLHSIYCDDFRLEINNKISLMGLYSSEFVAYGTAPVIIPKLCVITMLQTPVEDPVEKLRLLIKLDDAVIAEIDIPPQVEVRQDDTAEYNCYKSATVLSPLIIERDSTLKVLAVTEREELRAAGLKIKILQAPAVPST